ncbi:MAG: winged helix family two component transcriptional regulator [Candidatus Nomurabacteria bacterium]|nr:winged helix family two component transcriptional regulator [Candidatus Nomurabacteria bacterium]
MKILLTEDNEKLALSTKKGLEQEGYTVDVLFNGEEAERRMIASSQDYDAMILDVMLPGKDGVSVCSALREGNIMTPIIMLTAKDTVSDKIAGLDAGADDYLIKPFSFEELLARIRAVLRRPQEVSPLILRANNLELNTTTKAITVDGIPLLLTLREFGILEYLLRHPNQVISREQILAHVWDYSFDSFSNVVDVHIKNLRKKLSHYEKSLETLRGMGYRLTV